MTLDNYLAFLLDLNTEQYLSWEIVSNGDDRFYSRSLDEAEKINMEVFKADAGVTDDNFNRVVSTLNIGVSPSHLYVELT